MYGLKQKKFIQPQPSMAYAGGTPNFNESTGTYIRPPLPVRQSKTRPWVQPQPGMAYAGGNPNFNESAGTFTPRPQPMLSPPMINRDQYYRITHGGQAPPPGTIFTQDMVRVNPKLTRLMQMLSRYKGGM